jgi:hypothetical protein
MKLKRFNDYKNEKLMVGDEEIEPRKVSKHDYDTLQKLNNEGDFELTDDEKIKKDFEAIEWDPDYNWFIVGDENQNIMSGWEYLKDAFDAFVEHCEFEYGLTEDDIDSLKEDIDEFLMTYGYGEPEEDMDEYDQGELDEFIDESYRKYNAFIGKFWIYKRSELAI